MNFFASQNSVNYKNTRQQEDGRLYRRRHDPIIFMLHHTTTEPIEKTPEAANRSIDDRTSYKFCAYRYACFFSYCVNRALWLCFYVGHIGSSDAELSSQHINIIQSQMQSKGGYDINSLRLQVRKSISTLSLKIIIFLH